MKKRTKLAVVLVVVVAFCLALVSLADAEPRGVASIKMKSTKGDWNLVVEAKAKKIDPTKSYFFSCAIDFRDESIEVPIVIPELVVDPEFPVGCGGKDNYEVCVSRDESKIILKVRVFQLSAFVGDFGYELDEVRFRALVFIGEVLGWTGPDNDVPIIDESPIIYSGLNAELYFEPYEPPTYPPLP